MPLEKRSRELHLRLLVTGLITAVSAVVAPPIEAAPPDHPGDLPGTTYSGGGPSLTHCVEDAYEPDSFAEPRSLPPGRLESLAVCAGDDDYWRIDVQPGMQLTIRVEFVHADGDVDITLHRASDNGQIDISDGVSNYEAIRYTANVSESLILRVYGYNGVSNQYALELLIDDFSAGCAGDAHEPNDSASQAFAPASGVDAGRICLGDEDWFAVALAAGEGFDFGIDFDRSIGQLAVAVYGAGDLTRPLQNIRPSDDTALAIVEQSSSGGRYFVRVYSPSGEFNAYEYSLARYAPGAGVSGTVTGRVVYEDELRGQDVVIGASPYRDLPARNVLVEVVRVSDERAIATGYTDEAGRYRIPFNHRAGGDAYVRVTARLEAPGYTLRLVDNLEQQRPHQGRSQLLDRLHRAGNEWRADFRFEASGKLGGAFNIVDQLLAGFRFIDRIQPLNDMELTVVWEKGVPQDCASCFSNGVVFLGGGVDDPDEYDDSVILHEFGHYVIRELSHDDSPGGSHNGDRTNPLVAYGEGIATVFSMMVLDSPIYTDTMVHGGQQQDFERADYPEARGTSTGTILGLVSEYLVAAVIWDIYDAGAESHDNLNGGAEAIMRVLLDYMPISPTRDVGYAGADLADFLEGFRTLYPGYTEALDDILARHEFAGGTLPMARPGGIVKN
jgi:hypothetical protein